MMTGGDLIKKLEIKMEMLGRIKNDILRFYSETK